MDYKRVIKLYSEKIKVRGKILTTNERCKIQNDKRRKQDDRKPKPKQNHQDREEIGQEIIMIVLWVVKL